MKEVSLPPGVIVPPSSGREIAELTGFRGFYGDSMAGDGVLAPYNGTHQHVLELARGVANLMFPDAPDAGVLELNESTGFDDEEQF